MKQISVFLFILLFCFLNAQQQKLQGTWILDRITYQNGDLLEVNHPMYSNYFTYKFIGNILQISEQKEKVDINDTTITTSIRKLNYSIENKMLTIKEVSDDKIYYFLKIDDFVQKYPEFEPVETTYEGKSVYTTNSLIKPEFNHSQNFNQYIMNNVASYSSVASTDNSFKVTYILTADSKIHDLKVVKSVSDTFDSQFISALMNAEKFFKNTFGKDLLVSQSFEFYNMFSNSNIKHERQIINLAKKAGELYDKNDFEGALAQYEKLFALQINAYSKDRLRHMLQPALLRAGVANLAIGRRTEACAAFREAGNLTDFTVRNYLRNFCK